MQDAVAALPRQFDEVSKNLDSEKAKLDDIRAWNRHLYATEKELEEQVGKAFGTLGFTVTPGPEGRDDLILSGSDQPLIVEVNGLTKSAAEPANTLRRY